MATGVGLAGDVHVTRDDRFVWALNEAYSQAKDNDYFMLWRSEYFTGGEITPWLPWGSGPLMALMALMEERQLNERTPTERQEGMRITLVRHRRISLETAESWIQYS